MVKPTVAVVSPPPQPPGGGHGIPYSNEAGLAPRGRRCLNLLAMSSLPFVDFSRVRYEIVASPGKQAALVKHIRQHPDRIGAPAVSKEIHLVPRLIVIHQVSIGFLNVGLYSRAGRSHSYLLNPAFGRAPQGAVGADSRIVEGDLSIPLCAQAFVEPDHVVFSFLESYLAFVPSQHITIFFTAASRVSYFLIHILTLCALLRHIEPGPYPGTRRGHTRLGKSLNKSGGLWHICHSQANAQGSLNRAYRMNGFGRPIRSFYGPNRAPVPVVSNQIRDEPLAEGAWEPQKLLKPANEALMR